MDRDMSPTQCDGCSSKFSWLRKRRTCLMCRSVCCSTCMQRLRLCGVGRHCLRCARLGTVRLDRATLQQMTVRELKHIMKIVDVSPAMCREKSDLVDLILLCSGQNSQAGAVSLASASASAPAEAPVPVPAPVPTAVHRPCRVAPRDSIRVAPYDSIRVRAADDEPGPSPPAKQSDVSSDSLSAEAASEPAATEGHHKRPAASDASDQEQFVVVDVETVDHVPAGEEAAGDGHVDDDRPVNVEVTGGGGGGEVEEEVVVVDCDADEPESESVTVEVERKEETDDPVPQAELDVSQLTDVAQLPSEEVISRLTVRQCKRLLQHRRTDYRDVIEKDELLRRVRLLWRETRRNADALASAPDRDICKICMDSLVDCVLLECGHMATCTACGKQMAECPICRKYVVRVVHVFRS